MTEDRWAPGADVVDVAIAIDVLDATALGATDEKRLAADIAKGADGRINAAGDEFFGNLKKLMGSGIAHGEAALSSNFWAPATEILKKW